MKQFSCRFVMQNSTYARLSFVFDLQADHCLERLPGFCLWGGVR